MNQTSLLKALAVLTIFSLMACPVFAQGGSDNLSGQYSEDVVGEDTGEAIQPEITMSKEEIIRDIKDEIDTNEDILEVVPELKRQKDESGNDYFTYNDGIDDMKLEDLDIVVLDGLLDKVVEQANMIQVTNMNEQMEALRAGKNSQPSGSQAIPRNTTAPSAQTSRVPEIPKR